MWMNLAFILRCFSLHSQMTQSPRFPLHRAAWVWVTRREAEMRRALLVGDSWEARILDPSTARYTSPIGHLSIIHSRAELKNTSLTTSRPKQLHLENHVFQQLNHFPSPSPGLSFGWREIVERLAGGDGSPQHRCPWTTLTTSHG